ncbi:MAG: hypothetical protein ACRC1P_07245 [Cellulosilyticaceae bacterium]
MGTHYKKICIGIIMWILMGSRIFGASVNIGTLIEKANEFDKNKVTINAEVIGDVLERGEYAWINVNDGTGAIGIYIKAEDIDKIKHTGKYQYLGDTIKVEGIFYHAFAEQSGDMAIKADKIEVIEIGGENKQPIHVYKWVLAGVLLPVAGALYGINKRLNQ